MADEVMTGAEVVEVAEPQTTEEAGNVSEVETTTEETTVVEAEDTNTDVQTSEDNARFASVRRKAEADAKAKYEAEMSKVNAEFKRVFGSYKNPTTGKNIETYSDYIEAIEAQQRAERENELRSKGVDPKLIDDLINNSPTMRQAQEVLKRSQEVEAQARLNADLKAVNEIDPDIKTQADLEALETFPQILDLVNRGITLPEAYKLANFDKLTSRKSEAVKQAAINQAKGKNHMNTTNGVSVGNDDLTPIPAGQLGMWKASYPDLSLEALTKKYNSIL